MPVKSIVDIEVNDRQFKEFNAAFEKYQARLTKMPNAWAAVSKENKAVMQSFQTMTAAVLAQGEVMRRNAANQNDIAKASKQAAANWSNISKWSKETATSIVKGTQSLLKWTGIGAAIGSIVGIGGSLWGLEHLAASAAAGRRSSTGLGLSYGQQQAFANTYGRLFDAGSFLGGVSGARGNLAGSQAHALYALGLNPAGPGNTASTASDALARIRQLTMRTDESQLGLLLQTHKLGELGLGTEDLRRIKGMSSEEFDKYQGDFTKKSAEFDVADPKMKAWQDLTVQLEAAGQKIKSTFIDGLAGLAKPIGDLSEAFSGLVKSMLGGSGFTQLMKSVTEGLQDFAQYVGTPQFKEDVLTFVRGVSAFVKGFARIVGLFGGGSGGSAGPTEPAMSYDDWVKQREDNMATESDTVKGRIRSRHAESYREYLQRRGQPAPAGGGAPGVGIVPVAPTGAGATPLNNPGNLRPVGANTGFQRFATPEDGIRAMANNLLYYQDRLGKQTIRDIVSTWAPSNENDTSAYIKNVSEWTRKGADEKLDLHDPAVLAKVMAAMSRQEGYGHDRNYREGAIVTVLNNTGGNAIVQTSAMSTPQ